MLFWGDAVPADQRVGIELSASRGARRQMADEFDRALRNIISYGDTDIFPFTVENFIFFDRQSDVIALLKQIDEHFDEFIAKYPPSNHGSLAPVGYTGFRWASQLDPIWNAYLLSLVIKIGGQIEDARIPIEKSRVFSYRYIDEMSDPNLFRRDVGWRQFNEHALAMARDHNYVVSCDISEFYPRLNHHRLENAIMHLPDAGQQRKKIIRFLSNFSGTYSFGLPVGGPAARLLSELVLNQVDRLLLWNNVEFCRFADDFYLFANTESEAFKSLVHLSDILHRNEGLQLQKSKTRIMSSSEFSTTNPITIQHDEEDNTDAPPDATELTTKSRSALFRVAMQFDPYSPTAEEDYERLKTELRRFPILDMIKTELAKSRIDISLSRKLVSTLRYIDSNQLNDASITLISNEIILYPIYFNVLSAIRTIYDQLSASASRFITDHIRSLIEENSPVFAVDLNLHYAALLLAAKREDETVFLFAKIFDSTNNVAIRRDIIIAMARWSEWVWLSDRRESFRTMRPAERRAFIMASYYMKDEGRHWREHIKNELSPFEVITRDWMADKRSRPDWRIPL